MSYTLPSQAVPFGNVNATGVIDISTYMYDTFRKPLLYSTGSTGSPKTPAQNIKYSGAHLLVINNSDSGIIATWAFSGQSIHIPPGGTPVLQIPERDTRLNWSVEYQNPFQSFPAEIISPTYFYPNEITFGGNSALNPNPPASSITPGQLPVGVNPASPLDLVSKPSTTVTPPWQFAAIDTMKDSRDTSAPNNQLSYVTILADCQLIASLGVTHITVDVFYDYPTYMALWVKAVRAVGKKVWFRGHWNNWEGNNGQPANLTPTLYRSQLQAFIAANPTLFQSGDIFDPCAEANNSPYWNNTYGSGWTVGAPTAGTDAFNAFITGLKSDCDAAFAALNPPVTGVNTGISSATSYMYINVYYAATVTALGYVTIDSYPENNSTDPATCAQRRVSDLTQVQNVYPTTNIVLGEIGYNNQSLTTSDALQLAVLQAELLGIGLQPGLDSIPNIVGMNYWVGPGSATFDGTRIFDGTRGHFFPKPAAIFLATYYQNKLGVNGFLVGNIYPGQLQAGTLPPLVDVPLADAVKVYDGNTLENGKWWVGTFDPRTQTNVPNVNDGDIWFNPSPSGNLDNAVGKFQYGWLSYYAYQTSINQICVVWPCNITGTLQSISFFGEGNAAGTATLFGCVWDTLGNLLFNTGGFATTGGSRIAGGQAWQTLSFGVGAPTLNAGTTYKIGVEHDKVTTLDWSTYSPSVSILPFTSFEYHSDSTVHPAALGAVFNPPNPSPPGLYFVVRTGTNTMKIGISRLGIWVQIL